MLCCLLSELTVVAQPLPTKTGVLTMIRRVNDHWQQTHPEHGRAFWDNAAYHTGNMEAYFLTKDDAYRQYSEAWAERNEWKGAKSDDRVNWKYSYGETDDYVFSSDWQICFQTYIDLYNIQPRPHKVARAKDVISYEMSPPRTEKAIPGQVVNAVSATNFGVGAFLLASCEMARYVDKPGRRSGK